MFKDNNNIPIWGVNPPSVRDLLAMERTKLALERTRLANERTLLAYIRTSLTCLASAVSLIQFFENKIFVVTGYILAPIGIALLLIGFLRHLQINKKIAAISLME